MQRQSFDEYSMHTVSNQSINIPNQNTSPSSIQKLSDQQTRKQFLKKLQQQGYVTIKVNFQFMENDKTKTVSKKIKASQNQKFIQIFIQIRKTFKQIFAKRGISFKPQEGIFLFINGQRIVQMRSTVKEMGKFMKNDQNGRYLEITGTTIENFGAY